MSSDLPKTRNKRPHSAALQFLRRRAQRLAVLARAAGSCACARGAHLMGVCGRVGLACVFGSAWRAGCNLTCSCVMRCGLTSACAVRFDAPVAACAGAAYMGEQRLFNRW
eukprot:4783995-Pleurochrysis_carterae.AAC.1